MLLSSSASKGDKDASEVMISEPHVHKRVNGVKTIGTCTRIHDKIPQFLEKVDPIQLVVGVAFAVNPAQHFW